MKGKRRTNEERDVRNETRDDDEQIESSFVGESFRHGQFSCLASHGDVSVEYHRKRRGVKDEGRGPAAIESQA